jgi:hypothetical protein
VASTRKRERAISESPIQSKKKKMTGATEALHGLMQSIGSFGDNICKVLATDPQAALRTPNRRKEALRLAQHEEWLSKPDRLVLCNFLEKDVQAMDVYSVLDRSDEEFCHMWIQEKVDLAKKVA